MGLSEVSDIIRVVLVKDKQTSYPPKRKKVKKKARICAVGQFAWSRYSHHC